MGAWEGACCWPANNCQNDPYPCDCGGGCNCTNELLEQCLAFSGIPWPNAEDFQGITCGSVVPGTDGNECPACEFDYDGALGCFPDVPTGACCIEDNDCQMLSYDNCNNAGGLYWGDDTDCDTNYPYEDMCTGIAKRGACCCQECASLGTQCKPCGDDGEYLCENAMNYADCWERGNVDVEFGDTVWHPHYGHCANGQCVGMTDGISCGTDDDCDDAECCNDSSGTSLCCPDFDCDGDGTCQSECNECPGSIDGHCCYIHPSDSTGKKDSCWPQTASQCTSGCPDDDSCTWTADTCGACPNIPRGACCHPGGDCSRRSEGNCENIDGTYVGDDTVCEDGPCDEGACCVSNSNCLDDKFRFQCDYYNNYGYGFYEGEGCDQQCNMGACCGYDNSEPNCTDSYIMDECEDGHNGTFYDSKMCSQLEDDSLCEQQPIGACCLTQAPWCYEDTNLSDCTNYGGIWQEEGSSCNANCGDGSNVVCCYPGEMPDGTINECFACFMVDTEDTCTEDWDGTPGSDLEPPIFTCEDGACCIEGDDELFCLNHPYGTCIGLAGGTPIGPGVMCPPCATNNGGDCSECGDGCEICMGSCCYTDNSTPICETTTLPNCKTISDEVYTFGGFGTNCDSDPCAAPGACCHLIVDAGTCYDDKYEWECQGDLEFFYSGQDCKDIDCDNPTDGSCCLGGICYHHYKFSDCIIAGGLFFGDVDDCDGIVCDNDKCCQSIDGDINCSDWVDDKCNCLDSSGNIISDCISQGMINCDDCGDDIAFACCSRVDGLFTGNCADALFCDDNDLVIPNSYCADNPCYIGACCYQDPTTGEDVCSMTVDHDCDIKGGIFNLTADCNDCHDWSVEIGSCCLDFSPGCLEVPESVCDNLGGDWTEGEVCQQNNSCGAENWGACCRLVEESEVCSEESSFNCVSLGGVFHYHEICSAEICEFGDNSDTCITCPNENCGGGCPDGYTCCQPSNVCMLVCDEPCFCIDEGRECCPTGPECEFPCEGESCGFGPACPDPLECCEGSLTEDDNNNNNGFYCAFPCNAPPQLILCCTAPNGGAGNLPCETDNTSSIHECGIKTPQDCAAGGGAGISDCGECHDVCCLAVCCKCGIGPGCVYPGGDCSSEAFCLPVVVGYAHDGDCGEWTDPGGCGGCNCAPCASSNLNCDGSCMPVECDCGCFMCSEGQCQCDDDDNGGTHDCECCCCCDCEQQTDDTCFGWDSDGSGTCGEVTSLDCDSTGLRSIDPPPTDEILTNLADTHTYVRLPNGECIYMECVGPGCPYPVCKEDI